MAGILMWLLLMLIPTAVMRTAGVIEIRVNLRINYGLSCLNICIIIIIKENLLTTVFSELWDVKSLEQEKK